MSESLTGAACCLCDLAGHWEQPEHKHRERAPNIPLTLHFPSTRPLNPFIPTEGVLLQLIIDILNAARMGLSEERKVEMLKFPYLGISIFVY